MEQPTAHIGRKIQRIRELYGMKQAAGYSGAYCPLHRADKKTMKLIHDIEDLEPSIKDKLIYLANAVIRDAKTGKAYAQWR